MVEVSLYKLVLIRGTQHLWPDWFRQLADACEANPADRGTFAVLADACEEKDEPELAEAYRWLFRHTEVEIERIRHAACSEVIVLKPLPHSLTGDNRFEEHEREWRWTLAFRVAGLAEQIQKAKSQL